MMEKHEINTMKKNPVAVECEKPSLQQEKKEHAAIQRSHLEDAKLRRYDLSPDAYLATQCRYESGVRSYPRRIPITVTKAKGIFLTDSQGQTYYDCLACAGALPLGHNHPEVTEAVCEYLRGGNPTQMLDLMTPAKHRFIETLFSLLPPIFREKYRIQFCGPGGSDAVEAAIKLVKVATGRESICSFSGGYHGMSQFSLGLTGNLGPKSSIPSLAAGIHFLPYPYVYRSPFGTTEEEISENCFRYIRSVLTDPEGGIPKPAALILEIIQGEGGVIPAPRSWLKKIRELTRELGVYLIVDEVQTGFARTGDMFAISYADILPDILILSKAAGGGFPIALLLHHEDLDVWTPGAHAGTFRGNQIAMVAGVKTMEILQRDRIAEKVRKDGEYFLSLLRSLQERYPFLGDVRGRGFMIGIEVIDPDRIDGNGHPQASPDRASQIQRAALRRGLIVETGGRFSSVLRFLPPLILSRQDIDAIVAILDEACRAIGEGDVDEEEVLPPEPISLPRNLSS